MRKVSMLILIVFALCSTANAQYSSKKRTGFKVGLNYSALRIKGVTSSSYSDFKIGAVVGLFREIPLSERVLFQPELYYSRLGGKSNDITTNLSYFSIPALFKFHGKKLGFYVGPQASLLLSAKQIDAADTKSDIKSTLKSVDLSGITGFDYSFGKEGAYVVGLRYQYALNNIVKNPNPAGTGLLNYSVQASFGFRF